MADSDIIKGRFRYWRTAYIDNYKVTYAAGHEEKKDEFYAKIIYDALKNGHVRLDICRELFLLENLGDHPGIVRLNEIIKPSPSDDRICLIFEHGGVTLSSLIRSLSDEHDETRIFILYQLLCSLKYIHSAGIIHSELMPQYVLYNRDDRQVLLHFKHALSINNKKPAFGRRRRSTFTSEGWKWYKAPEWWLNTNEICTATDMWAFGCILVELYLKTPLFKTKSFKEDQLSRIYQTIGSASGNTSSNSNIGDENSRTNIDKHGFLKEMLKHKPMVLDLAEKLLEYDPSKRITAEEALNHPLFEQLHDPEDELRFDFSKFGIEPDRWKSASLIDIFEDGHQKKIDVIILANNIVRSQTALKLLPIEIWAHIFKFISIPSVGPCYNLVKSIFCEPNARQ